MVHIRNARTDELGEIKEIEFHSIGTENGDFLCYDVMEKKKR